MELINIKTHLSSLLAIDISELFILNVITQKDSHTVYIDYINLSLGNTPELIKIDSKEIN